MPEYISSRNIMGDELCSGRFEWSAAEKPSASFPACEKDFPGQNVKVNLNRRRVEEVLNTYRELCAKLLHKYEADEQGHMANVKRKVRIEVAMYLKKQHKWVNTRKQVGPIPGIEVGDKFQCRAELKIIGLHCQFESGIDYMKKDGVLLATSIVESNRYANVRKSSNSLTYIGHGGNPRVRSEKPTDQKLMQGNLALMNSMEARSPVRVILKVASRSNITYIYNGLYIVEKMTQVRGEFGKLVYSFFMTRISEQPPTSISLRKTIHKPKRCVVAQREVVCSNNISQGQEKVPIRVVTSINHDDSKLSPFDYIVNNVYPEGYVHPEAIPNGCDCIDGCMSNEKCACALKNGGRLPYDCSRKLTDQTNSLICECGPSCKCSSSCTNRVTQFGIQFQLEIFKTEMKGWGVRTRSFIPSGSFVCEFVGEICLDREANSGMDADQYSFNLGMYMIVLFS